MQHRRLGRSGLSLPVFILDTRPWDERADEERARSLTATYVDGGGCAFFTDPVAKNGAGGELFGALWHDFLPRRNATIIARAGAQEAGEISSYRDLLLCLDDTLEQLGTDYLDLWLLGPWDGQTPLPEMLSALTDATRAGKVRYGGVDRFAGWQLAKAALISERALVGATTDYSLLARHAESGFLPACEDAGTGVIISAPVGNGNPALSSPSPLYARELADESAHSSLTTGALADALSTAAQGLGRSPIDIAMSWALIPPAVTSALIRPDTEQELDQLLSCELTPLPEQIVAVLNEISTAYPTVNKN